MRKKLEDESQRRKHQINCACTDAEIAAIDARRGAVSRGEYLRLSALDAPIPAPIPAVNRDLWVALSPMSANLNQIARKLNSGGELVAEIAELRAVVADLRRELIEGKTAAVGGTQTPPKGGDTQEDQQQPPPAPLGVPAQAPARKAFREIVI